MQTFQSITDKQLISLLNNSAVGILPTDTVYGIVARAADEQAVKRLYGLKHREHKPGTVIAASIEQLVKLGIKARYLKAVEQFWPGSVSVEIPHTVTYLNQGTGRQAFRIPTDKDLNDLLLHTGPLQTTSANHSGQKIANSLQDAQSYFGDTVDFYVDGGDLSDHKASTIIRIVDDAIEIIRQGAVTIDAAGRIQ